MRVDWNREEKVTLTDIVKKLSGAYASKLLDDSSFCDSFYEILMSDDFSSRASILDVIALDEKEIYDENFYRLWELYAKNVTEYKTVLSFLRFFSKEEILGNLSLESPVPFIEYPLMFGDTEIQNGRLYEVKNFQERDMFRHAIRQKFIREYNKEIKKEGKDVSSLLPEETYEVEESSFMEDKIPLKNLYFGTSQMAVTTTGLDLRFQELCWLEKKNCFLKINGKDSCIFQNLLYHETLLLDETGQMVVPEKELEISGYSISPCSQTRSVTASSLVQISYDAKEQLEKVFMSGEIDNEEYFERRDSIELLDELLEEKQEVSYRDLSELLPFVRRLYEETYGPLFPPEEEDFDYPTTL